MHQSDDHILYGVCLRLVHALDLKRSETLILALWIAERPQIFGTIPAVIIAGRRGPVIDAQGWHLLGVHLATRLGAMSEPSDRPLHRLQAIATHLGLSVAEEAILCLLALLQRRSLMAEFATMLKRDIGLSDEAVIAWCCNLDDTTTWTALAPHGRLVTLGLVQTDSMYTVLKDDAYALSGLLLALIGPPESDQCPKLPHHDAIGHASN